MCVFVCVRACVCVCACVRACVHACVCVCVEATGLSIRLLTESSPVQYPAAAVVSLNKEVYSHCSSLPSYDLAIAREANSKLCLSLLIVEIQVELHIIHEAYAALLRAANPILRGICSTLTQGYLRT